MEINNLVRLGTLLALASLVGCGGGGDSGAPPATTPAPAPTQVPAPAFKLEILGGKTTVDLAHCESTVGPIASARYSRLSSISVYADAVYVTDSGEGCQNQTATASGIPTNLQPSVKKIAGDMVSWAVQIEDDASAMPHPVRLRYPSGVYRKSASEFIVAGYAAAKSEWNYTLDPVAVEQFTAINGWRYYPPGLASYSTPTSMHDGLVAGRSGQPPGLLDGQGTAAGFVAPHNLVVDSKGLMYVIDDGKIRTIDANYNVKTLDSAALGIKEQVKAITADQNGNIHVLTGGTFVYAWYRLADGSRVQIGGATLGIGITSAESFTVVGDDIVIAIRNYYSGTQAPATWLRRVTSKGVITDLTGQRVPSAAAEFLANPTEYGLPPVQHVHYGVDGHLYLVLPQGVLIARNFK